ncbi:MAG: hypothetical protein H7Z21_12535 [Hymenobacter sp.]|nr:hypothetical protein [Hymenobacter sp.]
MTYAASSVPKAPAHQRGCMPAPVCYLSLSGPVGASVGALPAGLRPALPGPDWDPCKRQMS